MIIDTNEMTFGGYVKTLRTIKQKTLRETAQEIGVSPQFYSLVEKGRRCAFTPDKLEALKNFLGMTSEEAEEMYDKAAKTHKAGNISLPQDIADYVNREYVKAGLRTMKELNADKEDWNYALERIKEKKHGKNNGEWQLYEDEDTNAWECSVCHEVFQLMEGTPEENNMHYCHNCGARMKTYNT